MEQQEPIENMSDQPEVAEVEDIEALKQALAEEKKKAEGYLANWQRAQADLINYKKRTEKDKEDIINFANSLLINDLLPVLDDLEVALNSIIPESAERPWVDGIRLIERKFRASLESHGLLPIKAIGEPFDPRFHEAIRQDKGQEGMVIGEFQKGYMLNDKLLRPARVAVGNGEADKKEED